MNDFQAAATNAGGGPPADDPPAQWTDGRKREEGEKLVDQVRACVDEHLGQDYDVNDWEGMYCRLDDTLQAIRQFSRRDHLYPRDQERLTDYAALIADLACVQEHLIHVLDEAMEAQKRAHRLTFDHHNASDIYGYSTEHELVRDFKHLSRLLRSAFGGYDALLRDTEKMILLRIKENERLKQERVP
jgi:hypothetical protein